MQTKKIINIVDCHVGGETNNVIIGGVEPIPGISVFERMVYVKDNMDELRRLLLSEPPGAPNHCINLITDPCSAEALFGYIIMEVTEYPVMSGSNTICVATALLETGMVEMVEPVTQFTLESPAGLVEIECDCKSGKVSEVRLTNRPAFVHCLDRPVEIEGIGTINVDVAYGGMTYALVDAAELGFALTPDEGRNLCTVGQKIKRAAAQQIPVRHPENKDILGITQTEFTLPVGELNGVLTARNAVVVLPGRVDRSPCGTGTSARLAVTHKKREIISCGETFIHQSFTGSTFRCLIKSTTKVGSFDAVIPVIGGEAWIMGLRQSIPDVTDPFPEGFTPSDLWLGDTALIH